MRMMTVADAYRCLSEGWGVTTPTEGDEALAEDGIRDG